MTSLLHTDGKFLLTHIPTRHGPVKLTIFSPADAEWIADQVSQLPEDLNGVQTGVVNVGDSFIVLERDIDPLQVSFLCQCYRQVNEFNELESPELTVLSCYS